MNKFLLLSLFLLVSSQIFGEKILFISDRNCTIELDGRVVTNKFGGTIMAKNINMNGEKGSFPEIVILKKDEKLTLDLGDIINSILFKSIVIFFDDNNGNACKSENLIPKETVKNIYQLPGTLSLTIDKSNINLNYSPDESNPEA